MPGEFIETRQVPKQVAVTIGARINEQLELAAANKDRKKISAINAFKISRRRPKLYDENSRSYYFPILYNELLTVFRLLGITAKELFYDAGVSVSWPSRRVRELHELLASSDDEFLDRVYSCISALTYDEWKPNSDAQQLEPSLASLRIAYAVEHRTRWAGNKKAFHQERLKKGKFGYGSPNSNYHVYASTFDEILNASKELELSLTWLIGLVDGESVLLADSAKLEYIIAGFCFLSETDKKAVSAFVRANCEGESI